MDTFPTQRQLADEALRILEEDKMTPQEHFEFLISIGLIDRRGGVEYGRPPKAGEVAPPSGASAASTTGTEHLVPPQGDQKTNGSANGDEQAIVRRWLEKAAAGGSAAA